MRRLTLFLALFALTFSSLPVLAARADALQTYRNGQFGVTFQYPAGWSLKEQPTTQSVIVTSADDAKAIEAGKEPDGLVFSVALSTFRQVGVEAINELGDRLKGIAATPDATPQTTHIGGADGLSIDVLDGNTDVAGSTAMLSIGQRRVAVVRGVATIKAWANGGAKAQYEALISTLSFFPPANADSLDRLGRVMWQVSDPRFGTFTDINATADGVSVLATDQTNGIWTLSANGAVSDVKKYDGIGTYGTLGLFRDGTRYIADAANHVVWLIQPGGAAKKLLGGSVGTARGQFGANSPRVFTFGYGNTLNILDETANGTRIQVFGRGGDALTAWEIDPVQDGALASDENGYVYVVGKNTPGVIKITASGKVVTKDLGKGVLNGAGLLAVVVDRFGNLYVATADSGVMKLNSDGQLEGIIGEPYDGAAPPKPGQLGKPVALALGQGDNILYIADAGKYPQIMAVALNGNATINVQAGTKAVGAISYGQTVNGEITATAFVNTYTFDGKAGDVVTITARAVDGSSLDTFVDLLGTDGLRVAVNDDAKLPGLLPTDSQIAGYKLPYNGTYTIRATRFGRETTNATGTYTLTLEKQ